MKAWLRSLTADQAIQAGTAVVVLAVPHPLAPGNGHAAPDGGQEAARIFADELSRGEPPSIRAVSARRCTWASLGRRR
jgi:hypothetical protein